MVFVSKPIVYTISGFVIFPLALLLAVVPVRSIFLSGVEHVTTNLILIVDRVLIPRRLLHDVR